jgi:DNA-binding HxlR family transcriptional regulator
MDNAQSNTVIDQQAQNMYPLRCTARLVGDMWTLLIIYNLMHGTKRFGELQDALGNVSPKTVSQRLKLLEHVGFVNRQAYPEIPPRVQYSLTEKGYTLGGIINAMQEFGERYLMQEDLPSDCQKTPASTACQEETSSPSSACQAGSLPSSACQAETPH